MKKRIKTKTRILAGVGMIFGLTFAQNALAFDINDSANDGDFFFNHTTSLKDNELDEMRGGFVTSNGLIIDFAFSANTLVDGRLVNQVELSNLSAVASETLRNIVQIGEGNAAFNSRINTNALPNVLTVVQNNIDGLTIQQVNLLDLTVQNFDSFIRQSVTSEMNLQSTLRTVP